MPTTFPNGQVVYNVTPHPLRFLWRLKRQDDFVVVAESDGVLHARFVTEEVEKNRGYRLYQVHNEPTAEGVELILKIKKEDPHALIVGSVLAAMAYPDYVVAPMTANYQGRDHNNDTKLIRTDSFKTFKYQKGKTNNG